MNTAPLTRNPQALSSREFDVLVVGGGINGAACAWDAALRGFSCALIEKSDFGSAASAGCFKIVHGGLRYLQHLDVARLRESVEEQRVLRKIAAHLVHPLPFLIPAYGYGRRSKAVLATGMKLYESLASGRNEEVDEYHVLPSHKIISKAQCLEIAPGLSPDGLRGGVIYFDCQMSNCERFTFSVLQAAVSEGAQVCNYLEAEKFVCRDTEDGVKAIDHVVARDVIDGREHRLHARVVIDATGVWSPPLRALLPDAAPTEPLFYSKGVQVVMKQFVKGYALAVESRYKDPKAVVSRGGRSFFIHPWRGASLIGTTDSVHEGSPDTFQITLADIRRLLEDVSLAYRDDRIKPSNVQFAFGGLRPMEPAQLRNLRSGATGDEGEAKTAMEDELLDHADSRGKGSPPIANLVSMVGVKYTTFRRSAERVIDIVSEKLCGEKVACKTKDTPISGADVQSYRSFILSTQQAYPKVPQEVLAHLVRNYGTGIDDVVSVIKERPELARRLIDENETLAAELIYAVRNEMVSSLSDVVLRRTGFGTLGFPGEDALKEAASLVASELGWNEARQAEELEEVRKTFFFAPK